MSQLKIRSPNCSVYFNELVFFFFCLWTEISSGMTCIPGYFFFDNTYKCKEKVEKFKHIFTCTSLRKGNPKAFAINDIYKICIINPHLCHICYSSSWDTQFILTRKKRDKTAGRIPEYASIRVILSKTLSSFPIFCLFNFALHIMSNIDKSKVFSPKTHQIE